METLLGTIEDLFIAINVIPQTQSGKKVQAVMDVANTHTRSSTYSTSKRMENLVQ